MRPVPDRGSIDLKVHQHAKVLHPGVCGHPRRVLY